MAEFDWDNDWLRLKAAEGLTIRDLVLNQAAMRHNALEEMIERMLVSPMSCGIAVVIEQIINLDDLEGSLTRHYRLDPHVPYGHLYEFGSMVEYESWQERGCPPFPV
ncbi:hypothetical protein SEA_TEMPO_13 [Microbacterium phage Tempo]|nr:hypothetical protein SEA_TEMPO_13 [Microbacterium phage Tempo]UOW92757.1 hypothetical protein SEA_ROBINROSE_14 [Microbacterium phage RobinRose]